ncbi:MAG: hypothetical protein EYC70_09040 [Planctomycetota bacterium]|nr:MAG: hypothetical protein EYC70_09040 [Planctomycetota bacterium]
MSLIPTGVQLTVLIGPTVPVPAPPHVVQALDEVEVRHADQGRSGFQMRFRVGRSGPADIFDYPLLSLPLLKPFARVILIVTFRAMPRVLVDGIITNRQLSPSEQPGGSTLTITGEDVSVAMDQEEKSVEHPAQDETIIVTKILASYAQYGIIPDPRPPVVVDPPLPIERTPVQQGTDLQYLQQLAERHGYVFYVRPGPLPGMNSAYWGPPERIGAPQRAISVNLGPESNATGLQFQLDALAPAFESGPVQDRLTGQTVPVRTFASTRPPLAAMPIWATEMGNVRTRAFRASGLNAVQAFGRAQSRTDASTDRTLTATGELDALRYQDLLQPRGIVGLRGAGFQHDGLWYVASVTHRIRIGEYKQSFTLSREGVGALTPVVPA